ncbi:MAG: response regulator transcription factor [Prevotella sp.]|nr:response regulator transcription factor [Prevotella sp.]
MDSIKVLLVEDEDTLALIIKDTLESQGFFITTASNGEEGMRMFLADTPDVLVADVMMPKMDGFEMVRRIRRNDNHTPVLFLTARTTTQDVVKGFDLGANDYLRKPFGMQELIVRIKALAGRNYIPQTENISASTQIVIGDYQLDTVKEQLLYSHDGSSPQITSLTHRETEILKRLAIRRGDVVNNQDTLIALWGDDSYFNTRSLHVFITKLRRKLAKDSNIRIINVRGIGYKLI